MANKTYNITRQSAAKLLGVSTRTIDRYVKSWKLSYKKIANKVLLTKEELQSLQNDFSALRQEVNTEIVWNTTVSNTQTSWTPIVRWEINQAIDEKIDKFFLIFKEKDKMLEEKNKVIFMLQQRVSELETKLQHMIALPDYNKEKQTMLVEKEKLENKIRSLKNLVKNEKSKNLVFIGLALIFIALAGFLFLRG